MTLCVRYVQNTITTTIPSTILVGSTGKDSQLVAFDITITNGITQGNNANIFQWTGAGKIQSIMNVMILETDGGIYVPVYAEANQACITIDATGKIINFNVKGSGNAVTNNSIIKLLLVIGNY